MTEVEMPRYRLIQQFFGPDHALYEEGMEIFFDGVPNEGMEPLNELATAKMKAYIEGLEEGMRQSGRISRKLEDIVMQEIANRPREPLAAGPVILPTYTPDKPIMGNLDAKGNQKKVVSSGVRLAALAPKPATEAKVVTPLNMAE
jgi:hypothetical protein